MALASQIVTYEHEGNWSKALEYYDLQVRSEAEIQIDSSSKKRFPECSPSTASLSFSNLEDEMRQRKPYKGLIRSLQQMGCTHVLDLYCQGLTSRKGQFEHDLEFTELQYEAAWRAGNWDFSVLDMGFNFPCLSQDSRSDHFHENLYR
ncbi:non-specific serine,threonine protein kinase [Sarracenia purpurea var. burkii]